MKIIVAAITYNNADTIKFWLRHYEKFADEIAVWDDKSTDGTREILSAHALVNFREWPHISGINEDVFLKHWYDTYPSAVTHGFDWFCVVDPDEFLYAPNMREVLQREKDAGTEVVQSAGYNMVGEGLPKDDGRQIWEILQTGIGSPTYSKPVIFNPRIHIEWIRGRHRLEKCEPVMSDGPKVKLLHYRYLGGAYTRLRNAKNYDRVGEDKGAAWSCAPTYHGEHSSTWAESVKTQGINAVTAPL